jgi:hypothetical protein
MDDACRSEGGIPITRIASQKQEQPAILLLDVDAVRHYVGASSSPSSLNTPGHHMRDSAAAGARRPASALRELLASEAGGGVVLMAAAAAAALILANSPVASSADGWLERKVIRNMRSYRARSMKLIELGKTEASADKR